jgi:hypothetical protein
MRGAPVIFLHTLDGRAIAFNIHEDQLYSENVEVGIRGERHRVRETLEEIERFIREA